MKKLLVAALAACMIIGSFASVSMAYHTLLPGDENSGIQHRYNGSYYYDIGFVKAYTSGEHVNVKTTLYKGSTSASKTTGVSAGTVTCWSGTIQGSGASDLWGRFI